VPTISKFYSIFNVLPTILYRILYRERAPRSRVQNSLPQLLIAALGGEPVLKLLAAIRAEPDEVCYRQVGTVVDVAPTCDERFGFAANLSSGVACLTHERKHCQVETFISCIDQPSVFRAARKPLAKKPLLLGRGAKAQKRWGSAVKDEPGRKAPLCTSEATSAEEWKEAAAARAGPSLTARGSIPPEETNSVSALASAAGRQSRAQGGEKGLRRRRKRPQRTRSLKAPDRHWRMRLTPCRRMTQHDYSSELDTRIMILQASFGKSLPASDLEQVGRGRCTHCCTRVDVDAALASVVAAWPSLSPEQRKGLAKTATESPGVSRSANKPARTSVLE
jgi:hypothetical protein